MTNSYQTECALITRDGWLGLCVAWPGPGGAQIFTTSRSDTTLGVSVRVFVSEIKCEEAPVPGNPASCPQPVRSTALSPAARECVFTTETGFPAPGEPPGEQPQLTAHLQAPERP